MTNNGRYAIKPNQNNQTKQKAKDARIASYTLAHVKYKHLALLKGLRMHWLEKSNTLQIVFY